jgi:protease-4
MKFHAFFAILLTGSMVFAKPPATQPVTAPATTHASKYPTPAEVIAKMKAIKSEKETLPKVAHFDLGDGVTERPAGFSIFAQQDTITLRSIIERLHNAAQDSEIRAVLVTLGTAEIKLAQAQELRDALSDIRKAGKRSFVYADAYDLGGYTIATGATDICMLSGGELSIPGVGIETMFLKGILDKLGLKADYVQIGEYKGADEELTRSAASDELRGEMNKISDGLYQQIVGGIAAGRKLSREKVEQMIDDAILSGPAAKERKFVDHLVDIDGLRPLIAEQLGSPKVTIDHNYGEKDKPELDFSNPFAFFQMMAHKPEVSNKPAIALVYVDGVIVDGDGGHSLFGGDRNVGSDSMRQALRTAAKDDKIKAVVVRINSPGGSAIASEAIWQSVRRVAQDKPVIISVGSMAASGGYYIASSGDYIFADPGAIVGSIGVVGGKIVWKDLLEKLGVTTETFSRGSNADMYSWTQPFSERQRKLITTSMKQTYEMFTERVMSTRTGKIHDIDKVARGRVFIAGQAKDLGMVDEIGGMTQALAFAADQADLKTGDYDIRVLPAPRSIMDLLMRGGDEALTPIKPNVSISELSMLKILPTQMTQALEQQLTILQMLSGRSTGRVVLASPFMMTIK